MVPLVALVALYVKQVRIQGFKAGAQFVPLIVRRRQHLLNGVVTRPGKERSVEVNLLQFVVLLDLEHPGLSHDGICKNHVCVVWAWE